MRSPPPFPDCDSIRSRRLALRSLRRILPRTDWSSGNTGQRKICDRSWNLWRYHPIRKSVEVLSTGTTNPWGHDWNEFGDLFFIKTVNGHFGQSIPGAHYNRPFNLDPNPQTYQTIDQHADHYHFDTGKSWTQSRDGAVMLIDWSDTGECHERVVEGIDLGAAFQELIAMTSGPNELVAVRAAMTMVACGRVNSELEGGWLNSPIEYLRAWSARASLDAMPIADARGPTGPIKPVSDPRPICLPSPPEPNSTALN